MKQVYFLSPVIIFLLFFPVFTKAQTSVTTVHIPAQMQVTPLLAKPDVEKFTAKLKACKIMKTVMEKTGASMDEMKLFYRYYRDTIQGIDKRKFVSAVMTRQIQTDEDVKQYASKRIEQYVRLYNKFAAFSKEFPESVKEYLLPQRQAPNLICNPACDNIDFSAGSLTAWTACYAANTSTSSSFSSTTPTCFGPLGAVTQSAYDPSTSSYQVSLTSGAGLDPIAGALIPVVCPTGPAPYSCMVGDGTGSNYGVAVLEQSWMVTAATANLTYMYAVVLENPSHPFFFQLYFKVSLYDQAGNPIPGCGQYSVVSGPALPNFTAIYYTPDADTVYCLPWTTEFVPLQAYIGTCVTLVVTASDCGYGAHFGYGYFDATCAPLQIISSSPTACGGGNVTLTGPSGCATYVWSGPCISGSSTSQTVSVSCAGTYSLIVTSNIRSSCADTLTITINPSPALNFNLVSTTNIKCNGGNTGSATVLASGGTSPYTYSWKPATSTNSTITGLTAGTYTSYARDAAGCLDSVVFTITQPPLLTASASSTPTSCGGNSGTATATAGGGTGAYTYSWSPSASSSSAITGLTAGTYTITITDANGCTATASTIVTGLGGLTVSTTVVNLLCNGSSTGSATASITGGTSPYTYSWTPTGGTNAIATGLSAGTYTINVQDANGCTGSATAIITQPPALTATTGSTQTTCANSTGSVSVTAGGGTPNYTYSWTPSANTNSTVTGLSAGNYTVTITDANGCTLTAAASVTSIGAGTVAITASTNVLCFGGTNGSSTATMTGGTSPFNYSWTPTGGTNAAATGLSAGTYTITVTDANGCVSIATDTITQPPLLTDSISTIVNIACNGTNNGSLTATVGGGTPAYIYAWTPSGGTNLTASGLSAGTYTLTVTDANSCTSTASAVISEPTALSVTTTAINIGCSANTGSVAATVSGGTPAYTYLWTPSANTNSIVSGLTAGTYSITITDANGCTFKDSAVISAVAGVTVSISASANITCNGANNGSATANASNGAAPYTYNWTPAGGTNPSASSLSAGTYTINVKDANGCSGSASVIISEPPILTVTSAGPSNVCSGQMVNLTSVAAGGTLPYTYTWSTGATTANTTAIPASSTTYIIDVTDANGCTASSAISILTASPLTIAVSGGATFCIGGSATLIASASGGTGINTFNWQPGNISSPSITVSPTVTTVYTVQVTDSCGSYTATVSVEVASPPTVNLASNPISGCYPLCVQFRNLSSISSGTITQWEWTFGNGDSSATENPIYCYNDTGHFSVSLTATSNYGCSSTLKKLDMITIYPHPRAAFTYSPNPINILEPLVQFIDQSTDIYTIIAWNWNFGDGSSFSSQGNPSHLYGDTGSYCATLVVTDEHGCADTATDCFIVDPLYTLYIPNAFTPNGDGINDVFEPKGTYISNFEMYIFDRWGMELYHTTDIFNGWNGTVRGGSTLCQEDTYIYTINVTDTRGIKHEYVGKVNLIR